MRRSSRPNGNDGQTRFSRICTGSPFFFSRAENEHRSLAHFSVAIMFHKRNLAR